MKLIFAGWDVLLELYLCIEALLIVGLPLLYDRHWLYGYVLCSLSCLFWRPGKKEKRDSSTDDDDGGLKLGNMVPDRFCVACWLLPKTFI